MPRRDQSPIGPAPAAGGPASSSEKLPDERPPAAGSGQPTRPALTGDQVERWAGLIASGESEFPHDLAFADEARLFDAVRRLRRARLITYIARQIASDVRGGGGQKDHRPC